MAVLLVGMGKFPEKRWHLSWVLQHEWEFTMQRKEGRAIQEKKQHMGKHSV